MLKRLLHVLLLVPVGMSFCLVAAVSSHADNPGPCDSKGHCLVEGEVPGIGGGTTTPVQPPEDGEPAACTNSQGEVVACNSDAHGWFDQNGDKCYYKLADPQPPAGAPVWQGHAPGDGAIYTRWCGALGGDHRNAGGAWLPTPPAGAPIVDPAALAQQLIARLALRPPIARLAPPSGTEGLIGLPVWMWSERGGDVTGPVSDSMTVGTVTVSLVASISSIVWTMGDGHNVTCAGPGTPYTATAGAEASPDCGYVYQLPSKDEPDGQYTITATSTWTIAWQGGGQSGQQTLQLTSEPASLAIRELYVLNSE